MTAGIKFQFRGVTSQSVFNNVNIQGHANVALVVKRLVVSRCSHQRNGLDSQISSFFLGFLTTVKIYFLSGFVDALMRLSALILNIHF